MNLINNWIKNNDENETLDLSYLNLSELPILPQNLKKLICTICPPSFYKNINYKLNNKILNNLSDINYK
jgi:hypothetical protein